MNASQALHFREEKSSLIIEQLMESFRREVPLVLEDRVLHVDIQNAIGFIQNLTVDYSEL
jgi:histidine ammonia-lyase